MDTTSDKANQDSELRPTYEELVEENRLLKEQIQSLLARIAQLEAQLEAQQRAGKRQAAPFRKGEEPAAQPKKPGRKSGK
jgi:regulator of replication initiation timing